MNPERTRREVDWPAARRRLAQALEATDAALAPPPEQAAVILADRARALARPPQAEPGSGARRQCIVFALGHESYAIDTRFLRAVMRLEKLVAVPGAPNPIAGVTNVRGTILPVVDLRALLGIAATRPGDGARVIVLGEEAAEFGLLADTADEIAEIDIGSLRPPAGRRATGGAAFVRGIAGATLLVLDGEALLAAGEPWETGSEEVA